MVLYLNRNLYIVYIFKYIYGLNLYKFNLLLCLNNVNIFSLKNNIVKIKISMYRLTIYIHKNLKMRINNIIINKIKKFNVK
uniref:Uncharacterized protein n=1 Tax=Plasmodium simiovale TaxID=35085 RepID=A0A4P2V4S6_PLASM|nr:hypothetical protein [Plasmodium simiovale]